MTSSPLSVQVNFWVDLMISNRHVHIVYILAQLSPKRNLGNSLIFNSGSSGLSRYICFYMCRGDDTNNLHILIDLGFRTENQVQLTFMSPVPVVSTLGHMKSGSSGDDIEQTRQQLDFWNSSFETYSFSVLFLSLFFRENLLNPNHRRPQKKKKKSDSRSLLHSATHQCLVFKRF